MGVDFLQVCSNYSMLGPLVDRHSIKVGLSLEAPSQRQPQ